MSPEIHCPHQKIFSFLYSFDFTSLPQFYIVDHHPFLVWIPHPLRPSQLSALFRILISSPKIHQCVFLNCITYILVNIQIYAYYLNEKKPQICILWFQRSICEFSDTQHMFVEWMKEWTNELCIDVQSYNPFCPWSLSLLEFVWLYIKGYKVTWL